MIPDWQSDCGRIQLFNADCAQVMRHVSADLCLVDPPYGIKRDKGMGGGGFDSTGRYKRQPRTYAGGWDGEAPTREAFLQLLCTAPKAIVWGGNYFPLPVNGKWLVWNKEQVMPSYSDAELAWTNLEGASVKTFTFHCNKARIQMGLHPTQKPVELMQWCIEQAKLPPDSHVADFYAGSGSTAIACIRTGRKFIGIEKDPKHFQTARDRIERELSQQLLKL